MEKLIKQSQFTTQQMIFDVFLDKKNQSKKKNTFKEILMNQYGNYAIFTMIVLAIQHPNKRYIDYFLKVIKENSDQIKKASFGKKFLSKVDRLIEKA